MVGPRPDHWFSVLRYDPHRVNDARDVAEDRQKDVYPKVLGEAHLQEHAQRREQNRGHDAQKIQKKPPHPLALRSDTLPVGDYLKQGRAGTMIAPARFSVGWSII